MYPGVFDGISHHLRQCKIRLQRYINTELVTLLWQVSKATDLEEPGKQDAEILLSLNARYPDLINQLSAKRIRSLSMLMQRNSELLPIPYIADYSTIVFLLDKAEPFVAKQKAFESYLSTVRPESVVNPRAASIPDLDYKLSDLFNGQLSGLLRSLFPDSTAADKSQVRLPGQATSMLNSVPGLIDDCRQNIQTRVNTELNNSLFRTGELIDEVLSGQEKVNGKTNSKADVKTDDQFKKLSLELAANDVVSIQPKELKAIHRVYKTFTNDSNFRMFACSCLSWSHIIELSQLRTDDEQRICGSLAARQQLSTTRLKRVIGTLASAGASAIPREHLSPVIISRTDSVQRTKTPGSEVVINYVDYEWDISLFPNWKLDLWKSKELAMFYK